MANKKKEDQKPSHDLKEMLKGAAKRVRQASKEMAQTLGKKQKKFDEEEFASNLETEDGIYEETADGLVKTSTKPGQKAATKKKQPETVPQTGDQLSPLEQASYSLWDQLSTKDAMMRDLSVKVCTAEDANSYRCKLEDGKCGGTSYFAIGDLVFLRDLSHLDPSKGPLVISTCIKCASMPENIGTIMWAFDGDLNKYPGFLNLSDDQKGLIEAMVLLTDGSQVESVSAIKPFADKLRKWKPVLDKDEMKRDDTQARKKSKLASTAMAKRWADLPGFPQQLFSFAASYNPILDAPDVGGSGAMAE